MLSVSPCSAYVIRGRLARRLTKCCRIRSSGVCMMLPARCRLQPDKREPKLRQPSKTARPVEGRDLPRPQMAALGASADNVDKGVVV